MTLEQVRRIAMALPSVSEVPHFTATSFRVAGRIFATAPPDGEHLHVLVEEEQRQLAMALDPESLEILTWGKRVVGLKVALAKAKPPLVKRLLRQAWSGKANVAPKGIRPNDRAGADARFMKVVGALEREPGVSHGGASSPCFGSSALKVGGKIFAMISSSGEFVVKLPAARVTELEQAAAGVRFQAGRGRPMKEWFALDPGSRKPWLSLAREALRFVGGGTP